MTKEKKTPSSEVIYPHPHSNSLSLSQAAHHPSSEATHPSPISLSLSVHRHHRTLAAGCSRLAAPPSASECSSCPCLLLLVVRGCCCLHCSARGCLCSILPLNLTGVSSQSHCCHLVVRLSRRRRLNVSRPSLGSSSPAAEATRWVVACFVAFLGVVVARRLLFSDPRPRRVAVDRGTLFQLHNTVTRFFSNCGRKNLRVKISVLSNHFYNIHALTCTLQLHNSVDKPLCPHGWRVLLSFPLILLPYLDVNPSRFVRIHISISLCLLLFYFLVPGCSVFPWWRELGSDGCMLMSLTCLNGCIFLRSKLHPGQRCLSRLYNSASGALMLEDQVFDESPKFEPNAVVDFGVTRSVPRVPTTGSELFPLVGKVFKSLNFRVAREKRFGSWVESHGFSHSINCFRIIIHIFALAEMRLEVFTLLRDIVEFCNESEYDAFELFSALLDSPHHLERSAIVFDVLMKVFASNSMLENAVNVFVNAKHVGLESDIMSCNFLLKCLVETNRVDFVRLFFEALKDYGPSPNIYTYTIMMNFYCRGGPGWDVNIRRATEILGKIYSSGQRPTVVTYRSYIHGLCKVGSLDVAFKLICNLSYRNKPLNSHCFNAIIRGFCIRGAVQKAFEVLEKMKISGVVPDAYSYSILIDALCKEGDVEKSRDLMEEMERYQIKPSVVIYTSLIHGLCKSGLMERAKDFFNRIGASGCEYDQTVYKTLIDGFCMDGDKNSATKLLQEMIINNLVHTTSGFRFLIRGFYKLGHYDKAFEAFNIMLRRGISPDTITCNYVLNGYCRDGRLEEALKLLEELSDHGITLNSHSYNAIMYRLCKESYPERALELLPRMLKRNTVPGVVNYSTLISGFFKQLNFRKSVMLFTRMVKVGIAFNNITYTILINIYCRSGKMHLANDTFNKMKERGLCLDVITYTSLIAGFSDAGELNKAGVIFEEMSREGCRPNVITYTCLIDGCCKSNQIDLASKLFFKMNKDAVKPDVVTYTVLIAWYCMHGRTAEAHSLYREMTGKGIFPDDKFIRICRFDLNTGTTHES
ncbi:pentatricopeptide repeat-containing protein At1g63330-like [Arachis duranensis]|uniref:Pentatricopeptide repeat-containing protein At1g63330-like n=1 Tax=Arachis duranensis TaxID=130453 RepID=A0A6P5M8C1_ARADU|nr:pentatricopeptide repeat-containing protein At1g63330-like [Arachis duranensis]